MQGWKTSIAMLLAGAAPPAGAQVAFTHQGELRDAGVPTNGSYDVEACLYAVADGGGDITGVVAGAGLSGGGTSGSVSLGINPAQVQVRVTGSCQVGQYLRAIAVNRDVTCEDLPLAPDLPGITVVADSAANVGQHASLVLGGDELPVIANWDAGAQALRVAKCGTRA
jgi:hypothetical protein